MAIIKPFKAIRPRKDLASRVAELPYDVMNSEEAREIAKGNPYSFLHVDKSEIDLPLETDIHATEVYEKARDNFRGMISDEVLIQDERDNFYIYEQRLNGHTQTGLVITASIDDYMNQNIKKHELTLAEKETDRINHVDYTSANTGPIFLTYRNVDEINAIIAECKRVKEPLFEFQAPDKVIHAGWAIEREDAIQRLIELFENVSSLYIADGHHRCASAVDVGLMRRVANGESHTGEEEYNYFLAIAYPDSCVEIMDYNRVVFDKNGLSPEELISKISEDFEVTKLDVETYKPTEPKNFGMYMDGVWYNLKAKNGSYDGEVIHHLDVSILQDNLLNPILGIADPRKSKRIDFVGGIRGPKEIKRRVDALDGVGFTMYPTTIQELMQIADESKIMPPKSTWFEPKPRSGLFIHDLID